MSRNLYYFCLGYCLMGLCARGRDVPVTLTFTGNNVGNGEVLNWVGGNQPMVKVGGNNVTIDGYVFNGSGIYAENVMGLTIKNCTFQNSKFHQWAADDGIFYNGLTDSSVTHCNFQKWYGDAGIFGYNPLRCHFDDNTFEDVTEGMHFNWGQTAVLCNSAILRNVFNHTHRYALEMQGAISGFEIAYNWAENFTPANHATMAYSLPFTGQPGNGVVGYSNGIHVHHNYAGGTGLVSGPVANGDQSWGFELGGKDTEFNHNIVNGKFLIAVCCTGTTPAWSSHDNIFAGCVKVYDYEYAGQASANVFNNQVLATMIAVPTKTDITSAGIVGPPLIVPSTVKTVLNGDGTITAEWTGPGPLYIRAGLATDKVVFPSATSPATIKGVNEGWDVWVGDGKSENKIHVVGSGVPGGNAFQPSLVTPATNPSPTTIPTDIWLHTDDKGQTWRVMK